jgi:ABC-type Zn2+ transport system substrate-binding protein/surface adhesin
MVYDSYNLNDMGARHTFSVVKGIEGEKVHSALALAYFNGADDVKVIRSLDRDEYELDFSSPKYEGQIIRNKLIDGFAREVAEVDPREEEIKRGKLSYIV